MKKSDLDSVENIQHDYAVIRAKAFLKRLYGEFYAEIRSALPQDVGGPVVEIGSGAGFLKQHVPGAITGDIMPNDLIDVRLDGQRLPFRDHTLKSIVMQNVFHHLPSPGLFLKEASRCLRPGGAVAMIEPWITPWSLAVYRLFHHERTDPRQVVWEFISTGPMSGANQALPWIVFHRDRVRFEESFPGLGIEKITLHTPFCYLLSGGVGHAQMVPGNWFAALRRFENALKPLMPGIAMFATVVLKRRGGASGGG